ncbi:L,D-transpeptidase family protein [Hugenholtzia roseola]|uniref:L,D-transpeptidase family protein n=1 Tax=Hugenholtzia roseola TaxID=1002 RepID=UPI0004191A6C|nr:L,D-transpeptidase family protein [Hugenholtzia roseola]
MKFKLFNSQTLYFFIFLALVAVFFSPLFSTEGQDLKTSQLQYKRVRQAYQNQKDFLSAICKQHQIELQELEILIRAFKAEARLEVWGKNKKEATFRLLKSYEICASSGTLGAKRKEGDRQVPEGFYHINHFNADSFYHLSMGINYPNAADRFHADKKRPGGAIYVHGSCVTIGCIPLTDEKIEEVYLLALEARNNGQKHVPVYIFPFEMSNQNLEKYSKIYSSQQDFWKNLKVGYDYFELHKKLPIFSVAEGLYIFNLKP